MINMYCHPREGGYPSLKQSELPHSEMVSAYAGMTKIIQKGLFKEQFKFSMINIYCHPREGGEPSIKQSELPL